MAIRHDSSGVVQCCKCATKSKQVENETCNRSFGNGFQSM